MNFFSKIEPLLDKNQSISMAIRKDEDGRMTVSVIPKIKADDKAVKKLKPLHATGTAEQLDTHLADALTKPFENTMTLASQIVDYEEHVKDVEKDTKMKGDEKKSGEGKVDKLLKAIDKDLENKAYTKAIGKVAEARKLGYKKAAVTKKENEVKAAQKKNVPAMFSAEDQTGANKPDTAKPDKPAETSEHDVKPTPVLEEKPAEEPKLDLGKPSERIEDLPPEEIPPPPEEEPPAFMNDELDETHNETGPAI